MCTISIVQQIMAVAASVIVALTENKVQVKYYIILSKKKGKKKKRLQYLNFYYNLSKRRKKTIWHFNTTLIQLNVLLELTSKKSFL